jgi:hypothetical protein
MKLVYTPFSIFAHQIAARAGKAAFHSIWTRVSVSDTPPPSATAGRVNLVYVAGSAALEAATMAAVGAIVDQLTARAFHHLLGAWPTKPADEA